MEECKSPEAEALVAAAVRGPNQAVYISSSIDACYYDIPGREVARFGQNNSYFRKGQNRRHS